MKAPTLTQKDNKYEYPTETCNISSSNNLENVDCIGNNNIAKTDSTTSSNTSENLTKVTDIDGIWNTNTKMCDLIVKNIISSNETDAVDAFIDYVEDVTASANTVERDIIKITDLDKETVTYDDNDNDNANATNGDYVESMVNDTNDECLAIVNILDHIEKVEGNQKVSEINKNEESIVEIISELIVNLDPLEDTKNISIDLNPVEAESSASAVTMEQSTEHTIDVDAGSSTLNAIGSRMDSFNSDDTSLNNQIIDDGDETTDIHDSEESYHVNESKPCDQSLPIPKTVDVSSVHYKDSIGCLTPDDDEDTMVASSSGYNANSNDTSSSGDNEPSTSTSGIEREYNSDSDDIINVESSGDVDVDVKNIETDACSSLDFDDNDNISDAAEPISNELDNADCSVSNIPEVDSLTNVDFQTINEPVGNLDHELVAASSNDVQSGEANNLDATSDNDSNSRLIEISSSIQEGAIASDNTESNIDNSGINDAVFEEPSIPNDDYVTPTIHDTNDNSETEVNLPRPSGSIRRVRFSLDQDDDQENTSVSSGSFSEQQAIPSSSQSKFLISL